MWSFDLPLQFLRHGKPHHSLRAQTPNLIFALNARPARTPSAPLERVRNTWSAQHGNGACTLWACQSPNILSHVDLHFPLLCHFFPLSASAHKKKGDILQPCDTEYPSFVYEPSVKETNSIIKCGRCQKWAHGRQAASLHCSPPWALKLSFQNPFSTALPHSAYRAAGREQNLITARTKVTQRPRSIWKQRGRERERVSDWMSGSY